LPVSGVSAEAVTIERGGRVVIDAVSFRVGAGDALVLTGPNGAGKTTLIRALAGFLTPSAGSIRVNGGDAAQELATVCHYVGHRDAIKPKLTVAENIAFWSEYLNGSAVTVEPALDAVGLLELADIPAAYLSAGQKRRLGLARLLAAPRPIWLLDEPTTSLDAAHQRAFAALIERHRSGGGIIIAATHMDLGLADARSFALTARGAA
jgi:heme exporter protein A